MTKSWTTPGGVVQDLVIRGHWRKAAHELFFSETATRDNRLPRLRSLVGSFAPFWSRRLKGRLKTSVPPWIASGSRELAVAATLPTRPDVSFGSRVQRYVWSEVTGQQVAHAIDASQSLGYRNSVEFRFPFLDIDLVRFVLRLSYRYWPPLVPLARLHRAALQDLLPAAVASRWSKAEFTAVLASRIKFAATRIDTLFGEGDWLSALYVDRQRVMDLWARVRAGSGEVSSTDARAVWAIATLETWLRQVSGYTTRHDEDGRGSDRTGRRSWPQQT